jgi:tetratricopeptide (TPR) repeat protein
MDASAAIALLSLISVALIGVTVLSWAYVGSGSVAVLFWEILPAPEPLTGTALIHFQQGVSAYRAQQYRRAIEQFSQALQMVPNLVEATHNIGLAFANLRQDDRATEHLLKAVDEYLARRDRASADLVRLQLTALRTRRLQK